MPEALTDKDYRRQVKRIKKLIKKWHSPLVGWWRVEHAYYREGLSPEDRAAGALASTHAEWEYLMATISWDIPEVAQTSDEYLEYAMVHELCHLLVNEMHADGVDHEERVVTTLARAFKWIRENPE